MSSRERANRPFAVFGFLVGIGGAAALGVSWSVFPPAHWEYLAVVAAAALVAEAMAVALPGGGSASLSYPLSVAATALLGPAGGGIVAGVSGVNYGDLIRRRPLSVYAGNVGQVVLCSVLSGWAYIALGGRALLGSATPRFVAGDFPGVLPAVAALVLVGLGMNAALASVGVSLLRSVPFRIVWRSSISWALPLQTTLGVLGLAIAQVLSIAPVAFLLFVFPLIVARQFYQRFVGLKDAYLDTVGSLVAAIEAKDPYTRGHSERVAEMAAGIGRSLGMADERVQKLVFAALLHDVGKVGIAARILGKLDALSHDEFEEIRRHPSIGAHILERVPYLAEVVPAVLSHHERFDGAGYGQGLKAQQVPLEARVLAVADSFDAMTTRRPYRAALSPELAIAAIRAEAGTQFDPEVVEHFLAVVEQPPLDGGAAASPPASSNARAAVMGDA